MKAKLEQELKSSGWHYPMESYPQGAKLSMLVMHTQPLWEQGGAVIPTLAWMAEQRGRLFDSYWAYYRDDMHFRQFFDQHVAEHLYLLSKYFDVEWLFLGERARDLLHPVGALDESRVFPDYLSLYRDRCRQPKLRTKTAVIIPQRHSLDQQDYRLGEIAPWADGIYRFYCPENGAADSISYPMPDGAEIYSHPFMRGFGRLQFYLWPEIYFRKALGFTDDIEPEMVKRLGIKKVCVAFCDPAPWEQAGFQVEVIDQTRPKDDEWSITLRCFKRWQHKAKGLAHGIWQHDKLHPGWLGFMIRNRYLAVFHRDWQKSMPTVGKLAKQIGNRHVLGGGDDYRSRSWDHEWMREHSRYGVGRWKLPTECGVASIERGMRTRCPKPEVTPWDIECSDEYLRQCAEQGKIAVCHIWGGTDIGYAPMLWNMMDISEAFGYKCGFAFHLPWVEYYREAMQKMFTTTYAPWVEPVLWDTGLSWFYAMSKKDRHHSMPAKELKAQLQFAIAMIEKLMGPDYVPRGHCMPLPEPCLQRIRPMLKSLGFAYALGSQPAKSTHPAGRVLGEAKDTFAQIYYTRFPVQGEPGKPETAVNGLRWVEKNLEGPGTILTSCDTGMGLMINALNFPRTVERPRGPEEMIPKSHWGYNLAHRAWVINYVTKGGKSGRLFPCKPNELVRYARMVER